MCLADVHMYHWLMYIIMYHWLITHVSLVDVHMYLADVHNYVSPADVHMYLADDGHVCTRPIGCLWLMYTYMYQSHVQVTVSHVPVTDGVSVSG